MNDDPKPKRGRPRTLDADAVLDIATRAYWSGDPADISINRICELAQVSKPALYREFGNEDGLMRATLDRYAERVLSDISVILGQNLPLAETLAALTQFASADPKMETGCVFYKMRAGKHRLGPKTRARVEELDAAAVAGFAAYLESRQTAGDWIPTLSAPQTARYLVEQVGLALTQRASGEDPAQIRETMEFALSAIQRR